MKPGLIKSRIGNTRLCLALVLGLSVFSLPARADWDQYKPANLTEALAGYEREFQDADLPEGAVKVDIHPGEPLRVTVRFLGKIRDIKKERRALITDMWGKAFGMDPEMLAGTFQKEIEVQDGQNTYWLPIQNVLIPHLQKEVAVNNPVTLFVVFIGGQEKDWVFLVNEFQAD